MKRSLHPPRAGGIGWAALAAVITAAGLSGEPAPLPRVRIEPAAPQVPANHLKFYLQFAGPMERGEVFRHLRLVETDESGKEIAVVPEPFREVELWDETFTRLTLWFHPGRQKPGVNLNVEVGPILEPGKPYRLEISGKWRTESGAPLGDTIRHPIIALTIDESQPDPASWTIEHGVAPVIRTDDLLDPASALKSVSVRNADGSGVDRVTPRLVHLASDQKPGFVTGIVLARDGGWLPGDYRIQIDSRLEDLAGNSVARPFNLDLEKRPGFRERTEPVTIPLKIP